MFDRANEPKEATLPGFVAWLERKDRTKFFGSKRRPFHFLLFGWRTNNGLSLSAES